MTIYGKMPIYLGRHDFNLPEVMYYLYLPVMMHGEGRHGPEDIRLPNNVACTLPIIRVAMWHATGARGYPYKYAYLSARKGVATPGNALNRPGWHCDGFGTDDLNYVWWTGPGTRFAIQPFEGIVSDHNRSLTQFDEQVRPENVVTYPEKGLYQIAPDVVHATPEITETCWRQYVKISLSDHRYNLENNSYNYLFQYDWPLHSREIARNSPTATQRDYP